MIFGLLLFVAMQEPDRSVVSWQTIDSTVEGDKVHYQVHALAIDGPELFLRAEQTLLVFDRAQYQAMLSGPSAGVDAAPEPTARMFRPGWAALILEAVGLPPGSAPALLRMVMDDGLQLRTPSLELAAGRLDYDGQLDQVLLERVSATLPQGYGPDGWPLSLHSPRVVETADGSVLVEDASMTTCDDDRPHYELRFRRLDGELIGDQRWSWTPSGAWLALYGRRALPLPAMALTPEDDSLFGLRGVRVQSDRRLGTALRVDWGTRSRVFGGGLGVDWRIAPEFSTRRGFPLYASAELSADGYQGYWTAFSLQDEASDRHGVRTAVARSSDARHRVALENRWSWPNSWRLDADIRIASDPIVEPEFFRRGWLGRREVPSELYLRHATSDALFDLTATARLDDFGYLPIAGIQRGDPIALLEELPRARHIWLERPIATVPFLGDRLAVTFSSELEAVHYRLSDRDLLAPVGMSYAATPSDAMTRASLKTELAAPFGIGPFRFRPGWSGSAARYDDNLAGTGAVDRLTGEAFLELNTTLTRRYEDGWIHRVRPQVALRDRHLVSTDAAQLKQFDPFDALAVGSAVELSLRSLFFAPNAHESPWLDFGVKAPWWPDETARLATGLFPSATPPASTDAWGPIEADLWWNPRVARGLLSGMSADLRMRHDSASTSTQELYGGLNFRPTRAFSWSLHYLHAEDVFTVAQLNARWRPVEAWEFAVLQQDRVTGSAVLSQRYSVAHYSHDWIVEVGMAQNDRTGVSGLFFAFEPRFLSGPPSAYRR